MTPHFVDQLSPETRARLTPEMLMQIDQQEALKKQALQMRPRKDESQSAIDFTTQYVFRAYPSMRYDKLTGMQHIIHSEKEERPEWAKTPSDKPTLQVSEASRAFDSERERLEDENERLQQELQELQQLLAEVK